MRVDTEHMGWYAFRHFRKTWLRGQRCQENVSIFWMGHPPKTMSEIYSQVREDIDFRLKENERVGVGFKVPSGVSIAPNCSKISEHTEMDIAA